LNTSHVQRLWEAFSSETGKIMALGARTLAMIWDSAWAVGQGNTDHGHIEPDALRSHYEDANFVRSVTVDEIEAEIAHPSPVGTPAAGAPAGRHGSRPVAVAPRDADSEAPAVQTTARRRKRPAPRKRAAAANQSGLKKRQKRMEKRRRLTR